MNNCIQTHCLYRNIPDYLQPLFDHVYPWEILPHIGAFAETLLSQGLEGYTLLKKGVLVGKNVRIHESAVILAPAIIGSGTEIRPGAYLRGNVITGENCVLGNSSELKNCILLHKAQVPHYNYVGDSILGERAHLGAGAICSNLKSDGKEVIIHGQSDYPTGLRKVGAFLADGADIGCGCVLNPATIVGANTSVYPLTALRGIYPPDCIVKSTQSIVKRK